MLAARLKSCTSQSCQCRAFPGRRLQIKIQVKSRGQDSVRRTQPSSPVHQPLVCSMWASSSPEMARPFIAPVRSSLTSSNTLGSLKWVAALTMARARFSASAGSAKVVESFMKMPLPTNTASAPSCMTSEASAGVAMPRAEKFGTQSFPEIARAADEGNGEGVLIDVVSFVGGGEDFGFVDVVDAEFLKNLGFGEVSDAALRHDR